VSAGLSSVNPGDKFSTTSDLSTGKGAAQKLFAQASSGKGLRYRGLPRPKCLMEQAKIRLSTKTGVLYY